MKLLAFLDDEAELRVVDLLTTTCAPAACAIKLVPAGEYRVACSENLFECRSEDRAVLRTRRPTLALSGTGGDILFLFEKGGVPKIWLLRED